MVRKTLEAPYEGSWSKSAMEYYFDFKAAGYKNVRIPVRWDNHTMRTYPYMTGHFQEVLLQL